MTASLFALQPGSGSFATASGWLIDLLDGQLVTTMAVLAIAFLGYEMMSGRIAVRRALRVVVGCFIVFGAPAIALGLLAASRGSSIQPSDPLGPAFITPTPAPLPSARPPRTGNPFDPYAGAPPRN